MRRLVGVLVAAVLAVSCSPGSVPPEPAASSASPPPSSQPPDPVDAIYAHMYALHDLAEEHGPRPTGSHSLGVAMSYVYRHLRESGYRVMPTPAEVITANRSTSELVTQAGTVDSTVIVGSPSTPAEGVVGSLTVLGSTGCTATDYSADLSGAVVLVERGACPYQEKSRLASDAGAIALIVVNYPQEGSLNGEYNLDGESLPGLGVTAVDGVRLRELAGTQVTITLAADYDTQVVVNLLAQWPEPAERDVLIGAHLDSVPEGPGLNDNGSGVAFALYLAQHFAQTGQARGLRFAFWDAEEVGLIGSMAYVKSMGVEEELGMDAYINFDMLASPNGIVGLYGDGLPYDTFAQAFHDHGAIIQEITLSGSSDHAFFQGLDIPIVGLHSGAGDSLTPTEAARFGGIAGEPYDPCYHRACDTIDNVDVPLARAHIRVFAEAAVDAIAALEDER